MRRFALAIALANEIRGLIVVAFAGRAMGWW
jgi:hypothetical protein